MRARLTETSGFTGLFNKYFLLFAAELQRYCCSTVLQDRPLAPFTSPSAFFIGAVKRLEQESNHLKQIGNVSAALVKAEERQAQAARGAGVGGKDAPDADDGSAFLSGW